MIFRAVTRCRNINYLALFVAMVMAFAGCGMSGSRRYSSAFAGAFDTVIQFTAYVNSKKEFDEYFSYLERRMTELSRQFDRFNEYEGIVNVHTINSSAGKQPVKVSEELYGLMKFSVEANYKTGGYVDVALGKVYSAWKEFLLQPEVRPVPPDTKELLELSENSKISDIVLNDKASTVFLKNEGMVLDVGATAKGYAVELLEKELKQLGCTQFIINAGGNVYAGEYPDDNKKTTWSIGVQNPDKINNASVQNIAVVSLENISAVTSGNYERYRVYNGKNYCHIINPKTLVPSEEFSSVTVITPSSAMADVYSTALFCMPYAEGKALADREGLAVFWIFPNGEKAYTDSFLKYMTS